jgi:Tubulin-tyrosine ligase family
VQKRGLSAHNFFELVRFDFIFDEKLNPYVVEVNMSPNLTPASDYYEENGKMYEQIVFNTMKIIGTNSYHEFKSRLKIIKVKLIKKTFTFSLILDSTIPMLLLRMREISLLITNNVLKTTAEILAQNPLVKRACHVSMKKICIIFVKLIASIYMKEILFVYFRRQLTLMTKISLIQCQLIIKFQLIGSEENVKLIKIGADNKIMSY